MRDQRAEALAKILVNYSTRVQKGDVCVIQGTTAAEPLVQPVYEEMLRAGGLPVMQMTTNGAQAAFFEHASDDQLDCVPPPSEWAAEQADMRIAIMSDVNTRALSRVDPKKQARAQKARQRPDGGGHAALGRRRAPLVADAVPDAFVRVRGRHVAGGLRGLLLRRMPRHGRRPGHRLAAPVGPGEPSGRVDPGARGDPHPARRGPTSR